MPRLAPALLLFAAAIAAAAACSRSDRPPAGGALRSPAEVTPGEKRATPPRPLPPPAPAPAPAAAPASGPTSLPDVFALPPVPGSLVTDAQGRRFPFDQALVTVAPGTSREEVDRIAASVRGRVVGQIVSARLYQLLLPTRSVDELEVALDRLRKEPKVKDATPNLMRNPARPAPPPTPPRAR